MGPFISLLHGQIPFKMTANVLDGFFLIDLTSVSVTLRVGIGFISKELVGSFEVDGLGWSLSLGIDRDV